MARDARLSAGSIGDNEVRRKSCMHGTDLPPPVRLLRRYTRGGTGLLKAVMARSTRNNRDRRLLRERAFIIFFFLLRLLLIVLSLKYTLLFR